MARCLLVRRWEPGDGRLSRRVLRAAAGESSAAGSPRSTKLFEFKTELYADILLHLERLHQRLSTVKEMIINVKAENREYFEQINNFYGTVDTIKRLDEEFDGKPAETISASDRERIKSAVN